MLRNFMAGAAALAFLFPNQASAQMNSEVSLFGKGRFMGARTAVRGPVQFNQPVVVRSIVLPAGTEWELCSGNTYTGCRQFRETTAAMVMTVRSARPVAAVIPASRELAADGTARGQSLRGVASEFFVAPDEGARRVEVLPGTAEAMSRKAEEFCRARGWRSSVHARLQTIDARVFLADVLCVNP